MPPKMTPEAREALRVRVEGYFSQNPPLSYGAIMKLEPGVGKSTLQGTHVCTCNADSLMVMISSGMYARFRERGNLKRKEGTGSNHPNHRLYTARYAVVCG